MRRRRQSPRPRPCRRHRQRRRRRQMCGPQAGRRAERRDSMLRQILAGTADLRPPTGRSRAGGAAASPRLCASSPCSPSLPVVFCCAGLAYKLVLLKAGLMAIASSTLQQQPTNKHCQRMWRNTRCARLRPGRPAKPWPGGGGAGGHSMCGMCTRDLNALAACFAFSKHAPTSY